MGSGQSSGSDGKTAVQPTPDPPKREDLEETLLAEAMKQSLQTFEEEKKKQKKIITDPRQRVLIQVIQIIRHMFRDYFGMDGFDKQGFFVDRHLSAKVNAFVGWVEYPAGTQRIRGYKEVLEISWDGYEVFTAAENHTIDVLDLIKHCKIGELVGHTNKVTSLAFHSGTLISGSSDKTVRIWDTRKRELVRTMKGHIEEVERVDFSGDGQLVASTGSKCSIRVWSVETGECTIVIPAEDYYFWPMRWLGSTIVTRARDKGIQRLDPRSGAVIETISEPLKGKVVCELMLSCDESMLVCSADGILVLDWPEMKSATRHRISQASIRCMDVHPWKPNLVAVGCTHECGWEDEDWVCLFDIGQSKRVRSFSFGNYVNSLRFTPNGLRLAVTSDSRELCVRDISEYVDSL